MANFKEFNINSCVHVKLTELGVEQYRAHWAQYGIENRFPTKDPNGYCEFQMWDLMRIFGPHLYNGCKLVMETRILIEERYLDDATV